MARYLFKQIKSWTAGSLGVALRELTQHEEEGQELLSRVGRINPKIGDYCLSPPAMGN